MCVCVRATRDESGVVLGPPKDTADVQTVPIFLTLAEKTHVPTLLLLFDLKKSKL